jgi:ADP-ribose pyrophosphatase YjhB (NUDIX family)
MEVIESKPDNNELQKLKAKYGEPIIRRIDRKDVNEIVFPLNLYEDCKGEGVGLIFDRNDRYLLVKKANEDSWFFPSGRIWKEETIEEGTKREVCEETGLRIELGEMPCIHIVDLCFKNCILRLWHFVFTARSYTGQLKSRDNEEIGECGFFTNSPSSIEFVLEDAESNIAN